MAGPDVEATVIIVLNLPGAPDTLAFAKAAIKDVMRAEITFRPMTFETAGVVTAFNQELSNVVIAIPAHGTVRACEGKIHAVPIAGTVVVEARPRSRWE